MKRLLVFVCWVLVGHLIVSADLSAQDLVITNARIIDGNGGVIADGTVIVADGRVTSVSAGALTGPDGARLIDAQGLTLMPGFIDAHRHIIRGQADEWLAEQATDRMREFLEAGFTALQSAGAGAASQVELRRRIDGGELDGPRIVVTTRAQLGAAAGRGGNPGRGGAAGRGGAGFSDPARIGSSRAENRPTEPPDAIAEADTRATIRAAAEAGVEAIKTSITITPGGPEENTLAIIADESRRQGLRSITHATSVQDTLAAVRANTHVLMHTPHTDLLDVSTAQLIADARIPMVSTLGVFVPTFAEDNQAVREATGFDNEARFRDLGLYPEGAAAWYSVGQGPVNARLFWDAGGVYAFGTDTSYLPKDTLEHELKPLRLVFSRRDIIQILTKNAAAAIGRSSDLGTLEPGKLADIVMIDGNPLAETSDLLKVVLVVRDGRVVVDKR